jgi:transposase
MKIPPGLPLSPEDWENTPLAVQRVMWTLWQERQVLKQQMLELHNQVSSLQGTVEKLREASQKNSQNSSKPPSTDPPHLRAYPPRAASGRKKGGQPGHVGKGRKRLPPSKVSRVVVSKPTACCQCGALLLGDDPHPQRHQVCELPKVAAEVIEYQRHTLTCCACGQANQAHWPVEMPRGSFGYRLQATIGYLCGRFGVSQRDVTELLASLFQVQMGLGSIPAQERRISQALQAPVAQAQAYVQQQPVINLDETGWQEVDEACWLWVGVTPAVTVFQVFPSRGAKGARQVMGEKYGGTVGSDRYSAYNALDPTHRQVCWAHLKRDFQVLVERGGESQIIGRRLLEQEKQCFAWWARVRDGTLSHPDFQTLMTPVRREVHCLLQVGRFVNHRKTRKTCQNLLKVEPALWTFVDREGVEPTNNAAERALRRGVLWRRRSFGTQSDAGSQFVARILTVVMTLRQQNRNVLDYLTEACQAHALGKPPPSLLPRPQDI